MLRGLMGQTRRGVALLVQHRKDFVAVGAGGQRIPNVTQGSLALDTGVGLGACVGMGTGTSTGTGRGVIIGLGMMTGLGQWVSTCPYPKPSSPTWSRLVRTVEDRTAWRGGQG